MNRSSHFCWFLVLILLVSACKKNEVGNETEFIIPIITPTGSEQYLNLSSDYIFDQTKLHTFELTLPVSHLEQIDQNPAAEEYVEGMLSFEGEDVSPVGIRYKGSIGAFVGCLSNPDWANPSGYKTCTKLSMKVKINWNNPEARFYDLRKLQFHSMNLDKSQMHERLGYWLFREMGVPAPRCVHARLIINGEYVGLFALTEQIDGRFTRYNWDDGGGNLYKEIWPLQMNGEPYPAQDYLNALKTNEDENPTAQLMLDFANELSAAADNELQSVISQRMDVNQIISLAVVDRMIRNDDGPFHWYCGGGWCTNHNYYWYEENDAGKLHLIPWDLDNAFENIISNVNPVTPIADSWGQTSGGCFPFSYGIFGIEQWSAACDKLTRGWTMFETEYDQLTDAFKAGPFSEAQTDFMLDTWADQIRNATAEARQENPDGITVEQWESELMLLRSQLSHARQ